MAEEEVRQAPILQPIDDDDGGSDNESVGSNEPNNTQQFSRLETELKDEMSSIARQVRETIMGMNDQMQRKFTDLDMQIQSIHTQIRDQNNNQGASQPRNSTPMHTDTNRGIQIEDNSNIRTAECAENVTRSQIINEAADFNVHRVNSNSQPSASTTSQTRVDHYVKLKPQSYTGNDDFEDFLTQFEITSEINGWDYKAKSLYLANSLTGSARALLNELSSEQRRDYRSLVQKLTERYGSENRAEVFRSQLKSRVRGKGETIAELAQSIRKLTRQAYPKVSIDMVEVLALDHFTDALPETEIRMRLREVGPITLAEAEKIAVRMEAHRIADRQRTRLVGKVEQDHPITPSNDPNTVEQRMTNIGKRIDSLQRTVQNLAQQRNVNPPANYYNNQQRGNYNNRLNRMQNRNYNQRHSQHRGGNPAPNYPNNAAAMAPQNDFRQQGNFRQPDRGSVSRLN